METTVSPGPERGKDQIALLASSEIEQSTLALIGLHRTIGTHEMRLLDAHHKLMGENAVSLMRIPYPIGFESAHRHDIPRLTAIHDMYDGPTEQAIHNDLPMQAIRKLARTMKEQRQDPNKNTQLVGAFHLRRTTVAYMRRYNHGYPVQLGKKD